MIGCERGHVHGASSCRDAHELGPEVKGDTVAAGDKTDPRFMYCIFEDDEQHVGGPAQFS